MKRKGFQLQEFTVEDVLHLLEIYQSEWSHRDELLWNRVFTFFYATVVVLFLPNLSSFLEIDLFGFPSVLFRSIAALMSVFFFCISFAYSKRVEYSIQTYKQLIDTLPTELRRKSFSTSDRAVGKFFKNGSMSVLTVCLMFTSLFAMSLMMIIYDILS